MKTGKYLVYLSLLALGLTAGVAPVYAGSSDVPPIPPSLEDDERGLFCLIESALSLLAARVADVGCAESEGTYPLSVFVDTDGSTQDCFVDSEDAEHGCSPREGQGAVLDESLTLDNLLVVDEERGAKCNLSLRGEGTLRGTVVDQYTGQHAWKGDNTIFIDSADFTFDGFDFGERSIKNFFFETRSDKTRKIRDDGLEAITQDGFPQEKWRERSRYIPPPPNGVEGRLNIEKKRIAPRGCLIKLDMEVKDTDSAEGIGICSVCLPRRPCPPPPPPRIP